MHQPPYPPSQGQPLPADMHPHAQYPAHQMQQLPSMPPPGAQYQEGVPMGGSAALQPGQQPGDAAQASSSQPQERVPLTAEQKRQQELNLKPYSSEDGQDRVYSLDVVQQPQRARMCGFGDKDRRPITPPPCVRLVVKDAKSGKEIDCNEIEHTMYVLNVDLWSEDALKEVNLVRHTTATPSISSTSPASYAQIEQNTPAFSHILPSSRDMGYAQQMGYPPPGQVSPYGMQQPYGQGFVSPNGGGYQPPNQYYPQADLQGLAQMVASPYGPARVYEPQLGNMPQRMSMSGNPPSGMFTRNLIGSLAASAFRLQDPQDKIGIWFILQDLSVRTEGCFRLRFSFVNVGAPGQLGNGSINLGKAPVLASVFSDVFQVYSAKKFPGVCESTALSKCFASQGIKIPIRKDNPNKAGGQDDDDYD
ncbi:velvet factor-domain-containing protein [Chaetomium sp. MPI-SDFR-AT-0129]|uniref:Velvet factor-domain-containing protein n=1 Tax=Dichotomopilus funicola TaxID=1934379 RepID=A0AAN6VA30_9PEZI|nr:velvet factor-domain-containing protein [Chaetomium sp. MPI-SDFR-AT-0129]KAK4147599.1 velvet factor-domain-containing protein [Dichotomopilus funicola]